MKIQLRIAALLAASAMAFVTAPASAQVATPVVAARPDQGATIPFELYRGNRVFTHGQINGVMTPMVLDTGASVTAISRKFEAQLGLKGGQAIEANGAGGVQMATLYQDATIEVGGLRLTGVTIAALDLEHIEKGVGREVPVILGRDFFSNAVVGLDFDARQLSVHPHGDFRPSAAAREVALESYGPLYKLPVEINGAPAEAVLDLGNGGALSISAELARRLPAMDKLASATSWSGGVGGMRESRVATIPSLSFGGFRFTAIPTSLDVVGKGPYPDMANVGIELLKPFVVTLDLGRKRMFLERTAAPINFSRNRTGIATSLDGDALTVLHVAPGSPADRAGLRKGDRIRKVGDIAVSPAFYSSSAARWTGGEAGTKVALQLEGGRVALVTLADYF